MHQRQAADDGAVEPGDEQHRVGIERPARPAARAVGGGDDDSCGSSRASASTSSSVASVATSMTTLMALTLSSRRARSADVAPVRHRRNRRRSVRPWTRPRSPDSPANSARCSSRSPARCTSRPSATPTTPRSASTRAAATPNGVALPDGPAYFTSRGSVMGQVPGEVVAAAFGVFNPEVVVPCVQLGWTLHRRGDDLPARDDGAIAQLRRLLGDEPDGLARVNELLDRAVEPLRPEGRALYAGLRSLAMPDSAARRDVADGRHAARVPRRLRTSPRGCRPDCDATEIGLLSELYWGLPMRTLQPHAGVDRRAVRRRPRAAEVARPASTTTGFTDAGRESREDDRGAHRRADAAGHRRAGRRRRRAVHAAGAVGRHRPRRLRLPRRRARTTWRPRHGREPTSAS